MAYEAQIEAGKAHFGRVMAEQLERVERLKQQPDWLDFSTISPIVIGILGGDGIGPTIAEESRKVLEYLLRDEVASGKVVFRIIDGLTIENRAAHMQSIPDDVLAEIKECHVTLKGPTHTPEQGDGWPNLESANVGMRKGPLICSPTCAPCACRRRASTGRFSAKTPRTCTPSAARA